jgi:hypothetical protein
MKKLLFMAGAAIGYVFGTRSGRQRYEQMRTKAREVMERPKVRQATDALQERANRLYDQGVSKIKEEKDDKVGATSQRTSYSTGLSPNTIAVNQTQPTIE